MPLPEGRRVQHLPKKAWLPARESRAAVSALADAQSAVLSRRQLLAARVPRWYVTRELKVGRWQRSGPQTVVTYTGPLTTAARQWVAVLETAPRAALAGVSALQVAGVTGLDGDVLHVIVPKGAAPQRPPGVVVHESRRFREEDVIRVGVPRQQPAVAAVHAALWARSDRQASLFVLVAVQQRLARAADLAEALEHVRRHRRRSLLRQLVADAGGGVHSLGELDVAADFRRRGFPEPVRQVRRRDGSGVQYLDCALPAYGLTLEIDGAGHDAPEQRLADLLRDIGVAADGQTVIRIPLVAYRLGREDVLDRIGQLLVSRGWAPRQVA